MRSTRPNPIARAVRWGLAFACIAGIFFTALSVYSLTVDDSQGFSDEEYTSTVVEPIYAAAE